MQTEEEISLWINEENLGSFAMNLLTASEDITEIFSSIDKKMEALKLCFDGKEYDHLMAKYRDFRKNYPVVKNNIVSYSDDLIALINKVRAGDKDIAFIIDKLTKYANEQAKEVIDL